MIDQQSLNLSQNTMFIEDVAAAKNHCCVDNLLSPTSVMKPPLYKKKSISSKKSRKKSKQGRRQKVVDTPPVVDKEITSEDVFFALMNGEVIDVPDVIHESEEEEQHQHGLSQSDKLLELELEVENHPQHEDSSTVEDTETASDIEDEANVTSLRQTPIQKPKSRRSMTSRQSSSSSLSSRPSVFFQFANQVRTRHELNAKAMKFREFVDVRDRTHKIHLYKKCFVGSEAVSAMIYNGLVETREEGVKLGRQMAKDLMLFRHVKGRYLFQDSDQYYQFRSQNVGDDDMTFSTGFSTTYDAQSSIHPDDYDLEGSVHNERLERMAKVFRECVDIGDRRFRLKTYKRCFVGREAVDMLVNTRVANTRSEAVEFGRTLAREMNLFSHVTGDHAFCDDYLFFRFNDAGVKPNKRVLPIVLATL